MKKALLSMIVGANVFVDFCQAVGLNSQGLNERYIDASEDRKHQMRLSQRLYVRDINQALAKDTHSLSVIEEQATLLLRETFGINNSSPDTLLENGATFLQTSTQMTHSLPSLLRAVQRLRVVALSLNEDDLSSVGKKRTRTIASLSQAFISNVARALRVQKKIVKCRTPQGQNRGQRLITDYFADELLQRNRKSI
jgi:hypothetical protein